MKASVRCGCSAKARQMHSPCCGSDRNAGPWPGCSSGWRPWGWSPRSTQSPAQRRHRQSYGGDRCAVGPTAVQPLFQESGPPFRPPFHIPATRRPPAPLGSGTWWSAGSACSRNAWAVLRRRRALFQRRRTGGCHLPSTWTVTIFEDPKPLVWYKTADQIHGQQTWPASASVLWIQDTRQRQAPIRLALSGKHNLRHCHSVP